MKSQGIFLRTIEPVHLPDEIKRNVVAAHTSRSHKLIEVNEKVSISEETESMLITELYLENPQSRVPSCSTGFQIHLAESTEMFESRLDRSTAQRINVQVDGVSHTAQLEIDSLWMWEDWAWRLEIQYLSVLTVFGLVPGCAVIRGRVFPIQESFRWTALDDYWKNTIYS
jgi:hypothetical protein